MRNESRKHKALTKAEVLAEAEKYTTRSEFSRGSGGAYNKARAEGYLDLACAHMSRKPYPTSLTYEKVKACAAKHKTRSRFLLKNPSEYNKAVREGWLSEICSHMPAHIGVKWDFGVLGIFPRKRTKTSGSSVISGLSEGITFPELAYIHQLRASAPQDPVTFHSIRSYRYP